MSARSGIEWLNGGATWPVVRGCSKVSDGCNNCWAIRDAHLHAGSPNAKARSHFEGLTVIQNGRPNWNGNVRLDESILDWPLRWKEPRNVFVASSGDLFHEKLSCKDRRRVFSVMRDACHHTYLILTKRAEQMHGFAHWWRMAYCDELPRNWWFGVSAEDADTLRSRAEWLRKTPASVLWVSYEPALGFIDWRTALSRSCHHCGGMHLGQPYENPCSWCEEEGYGKKQTYGIDWVVIGGESGPGSRPFNLDWARRSITQCRAAGVPVFVKQIGAKPINSSGSAFNPLVDRKGSDMAEWPEDLRVREYPVAR